MSSSHLEIDLGHVHAVHFVPLLIEKIRIVIDAELGGKLFELLQIYLLHLCTSLLNQP